MIQPAREPHGRRPPDSTNEPPQLGPARTDRIDGDPTAPEVVMSETRTPYRCARGDRCPNKVRVDHDPACECQCHGQNAMDAVCDVEGGCGSTQDGEPTVWFEGGAIMTNTGLCLACTDRVVQALEELPLDYVELDFLLASGESGITSDVVMGSKELQIPIRVSVEALQASMVHESQAWAEPVAERLHIDWDTDSARHCRPGWLLQRATRLLANSMTVLLNLGAQEYRHHSSGDWVERDGIDGALELARFHEMVRFAAGKTKLIHRLDVPCPRCQRMSLVRHNGADVVECESCPRIARAVWSEQDYRRLSLVLADDWRDEYVPHARQHLASGDQGTVGSAVGTFYPDWPKPPMVDFPASTEQVA